MRMHFIGGPATIPACLGGTFDFNSFATVAQATAWRFADPRGLRIVMKIPGLPANAANQVVNPFRSIQVFSRSTRSVSVMALDNNLDGILDSVFASVRKGGTTAERGEVRRLVATASFQHFDSLFLDNSLFNDGAELG